MLHPIRDMKIRDMVFVEAWSMKESLEAEVRSFKAASCDNLEVCYGKMHKRKQLDDAVSRLQHQLSDESLQMLPEYHQRIQVLKNLRYIDEDNAVQLKGRVACEISTCDELIATELVFENALTDMDPAEIVALLSGMVFQEKVDTEVRAQRPCTQDPPSHVFKPALLFGKQSLYLVGGNYFTGGGTPSHPSLFAKLCAHCRRCGSPCGGPPPQKKF